MQKIVVLTGAGISAESGISTFRDSNGLWENHHINDVATPEGWRKNPSLVLEFYNQRRAQLNNVLPNKAHEALVDLESKYDTVIVTQNVDDLHERAGSKNVIHLHGELLKVRSTKDEKFIIPWNDDVNFGDHCPLGSQLRPHIVWFGEEVPMLSLAAAHCHQADYILIIGTSLQVYPAAGLMAYSSLECILYYIDPNPILNHELKQIKNLHVLKSTATEGVPELVKKLLLKG